jgi:REP element-mobilizing transposase RayT
MRRAAVRSLQSREFAPESTRSRRAAKLLLVHGMGRSDRPNIPGATYHVMNRGNHKEPIFMDPRDRRRFLLIWREQQEVFGVRTFSGCLMGNHFHDIINTPNANLSEFMQQVEGQFARWSNWRHGRVGHLFQGRFHHVQIKEDVHLMTALCYVFMNPLAAGLCNAPEQYEWSTYAATIGQRPVPSYLSIDWLTTLFPAGAIAESQQKLRRLMNEQLPVAAYLQDEFLNVDPDTIKKVVASYTGEQIQYASMPRAYRTALRPPLEDVLAGDGCGARDQRIYDARVVYGYTNAEIARALRLDPATVSKIFRRRQRLTVVE